MRSLLLLFVLVGCGGGLTIDEYPSAVRDAFCKYLARCGSFPDVDTCKRANIGINLVINPSDKASVDQGKVIFDGSLAQDCLDAFASQTCDTTDQDGRAFSTAKCRDIIKGTVGNGGACALGAECKSGTCNVPTCSMACCQGTCMGDAPPAPGGAGAMCTTSSACAVGFYCDFTNQVCAELKAAGATCSSTNECAYGLGCAGTSPNRVCKTLPKLGEACPDGVCRDAGNYCNSSMQCAKIGLAGSSCTTGAQCSSYYPCDTQAMQCTKAPGAGEACTGRCFDAGTFCDLGSASPTCVQTKPTAGPVPRIRSARATTATRDRERAPEPARRPRSVSDAPHDVVTRRHAWVAK
ncbi:MAG: hypothetical protein JO257_24510 [Deltaproteobacteria bacterium]|nr:hypothetical protein [Deltaproteobacteria bacterium]